MRLPQQDSSTGRGLKTALQSIVGLLVGLLVAIWAVPGVPHVMYQYVQAHFVEVLLFAGVPSGFASFIWNSLRKNVPNY